MLTKLVLSVLTIQVLMKTTFTQFYSQYYENMPQQYYQDQSEQQEMDYEEMDYVHTRKSDRHKLYGSSGGKLPNIDYEYDESNECKCSCRRCKNTRRPPKPCCRETCLSCPEMQYQQGQGNLVFVPYPYPLMIPNLNTTTTSITTTTTTTTTTAKPKKKETKRDSSEFKMQSIEADHIARSYIKSQRKTNDLILGSPHNMKGDRKYMFTSIRKTKPTWEPKYGIVPIPDNLAEKLMSQLRQVRELQARRFK